MRKKISLNQKYIKNLVKNAILEDLRPNGDVTSQLIKNKKKIKAKIISNQAGIMGGLNFAKEAFKYSDKKINFKTKTKDGRKINKGKVVAIITGNAKGILKSERVALNFLSLISGVATITNKFVSKVKGKSCKICCTRKTSPNLRLIQKYGVRLGGGLNHRFNLSDEILIKDNHIAIEGDIRKLVKKAIRNKKGKKITVEVENLSQLKKIMRLKFDRVLFDNMNPNNLRRGVKLSHKFYETEASGGITLKNVRKIASTGVKRISVGQITHSVPAVNFKLEI
ncbi:MAG: carboxylating nicotinate-nucleotide diphosphorylase [Pelagibacteraceae bacterium]|nr:carboxylating nicotinate-nucleotide diphosphorylase [Pelagibacteraceae bacterium]